MRTLKKLSPSKKLLTDFYVFDTETGIKKKNKLKYVLEGRPERFNFGVIYGLNFTKIIYSVDEFKKEFLEPRYKGKKIFAHNAEYDLNVIYGNIYDLDPEAIFNGRFMRATNGNCVFADSMNIYKYSAKKIGEKLGLEKMQLGDQNLEYDLNKEKLQNGVPVDAINYCIRDCEIIYEALLGIFEQAGDIKITQASLSMTYYRRYFQPFNIEHNKNVKYFWNSYYGGRCEALKLGHTFAYVYDINSEYPYHMWKSKFPNPKFLRVSYSKNIYKYLEKYEGCAELTVFHKDHWIGYLPVKHENKLCFPVGKFSGTWNFPEIRFALENNIIEILDVHKIIYSTPMNSIFKEFIEVNYKQRFATNNTMEIERIKIFMNSLYGKFAQKIDEEVIYIHDIQTQFEIIQQYQKEKRLIKIVPFNSERQDCFLVLKKSDCFDLSYAIPSFSSYITTGGRLQILESLEKYKHYNPVYMDTDSIFCEKELPITNTKKLGDWKKEDKIVTHIAGLKNYTYFSTVENFDIINAYIKGDWKMEIKKTKGIPKNAIQTGINKFQYQNLVKTKEGLRRNLEPGTTKTVTKILKNTYNKRIVLDNGITKPLQLNL